ncbi:MAG TPA: TetR/AcrR family transcriptional regulator, partial [Mariprofundaceae bacterium]|nr:TetR/AcrR family transcriptional regulator [Mariprofundaceae bacterium]
MGEAAIELAGRERLLASAQRLFAERGYASVSIQQIALDAGLCKATVYHHFPTKEVLYLEVVRTACLDTRALLHDAEKGSNPLDGLRTFAAMHLRHIFEHDELMRLITRELINGDQDQGRAMAEQVFGEHFSRLVTLIRACQASGDIRTDIEPAEAAIAIVGMNLHLFQSWPIIRHLPGAGITDVAHTGRRLFDML